MLSSTRGTAGTSDAPSSGYLTRLFASNASSITAAAPIKVNDGSTGGWAAFIAAAASSKGQTVRVESSSFAQSALPADYTSKNLTLLSRSMRQLLSSSSANATPGLTSLETLYSAAETIVVTANKGEDLYDALRLELERAVGEMARSLRAGASSVKEGAQEAAWLAQLKDAWQGWCERVSLVRSILAPLDQIYILPRADLQSVWDLALDLFKHSIVEDEELKERAISAMAASIDAERTSSSTAYRSLHSSLLAMLNTTGSYAPLEAALHAATSRFYEAESTRLIAELDTAAYLAHATKRIEEEKERATALIHGFTGQSKSVDLVYAALITTHVEVLVAGLPELLDSNATESLMQLYTHVRLVGKINSLRAAWGLRLRAQGAAIVDDSAQDDTMIDRILEFKSKVDTITRTAFGADPEFVHTQQEAFENFVNKRGNRVAELIAKYLDVKLKSGNKTMTDLELEQCLNEALILFRYTQDKDMFEEFYKRYFAKRLLLNRSASSDAEQSMLLKLKEECGAGFTTKLETMLKDISVSDDIMKGYTVFQERAKADGQSDPFELSVNVLTQAQWPTYPQIEVIIPADMAAAAERFGQFYRARNSGRRLHWAHSLGTCTIRANLPKAGEKELNVSMFQTVVLLLFNDEERLSYEQIKQRVPLPDADLKRTLQSLACGQIPTRVLRKEPQGKDVNEGDQFIVNPALKNDRHRIRINQIQMNDTVEETTTTRDKVMFDRNMILDAALVRIMKAKQTIRHAELITELVDSVKSRFAPDIREVKARISSLIEREYMERVDGEKGLYRYVA